MYCTSLPLKLYWDYKDRSDVAVDMDLVKDIDKDVDIDKRWNPGASFFCFLFGRKEGNEEKSSCGAH